MTFEDIVEILEQMKKSETVTLHQAGILLRYAIEEIGAKQKKDLCDSDLLTIKGIRETIKGL